MVVVSIDSLSAGPVALVYLGWLAYHGSHQARPWRGGQAGEACPLVG